MHYNIEDATCTCNVQYIQKPRDVYFITFSNPVSPFSMLLAHPTRGFFTQFVDFSLDKMTIL